MDVGFVRQVDLTGSFVNSSGLVHTLRLQVLDVLNHAHMYTLRRDHTSYTQTKTSFFDTVFRLSKIDAH